MGTAAVTVRGLRKTYGERRAVDGIDLDVAAGEVVALLGPNGAGKTTTVEILEGYRRRDAGAVRVLGHDPAGSAAPRWCWVCGRSWRWCSRCARSAGSGATRPERIVRQVPARAGRARRG